MKGINDKSKFFEILSEMPFIAYAAKKCGISRATIYRWKKSNREFRKTMEKIQGVGRENLNDIAEIGLVKKIKEGDLGAIKFYLGHNSKRYHKKSEELFVKLREELAPGDVCDHCGQEKQRPVDPETAELIKKAIREYRRVKEPLSIEGRREKELKEKKQKRRPTDTTGSKSEKDTPPVKPLKN